MRNQLKLIKSRINHLQNLEEYFQEQIKKETPSITNARYIKLNSKLINLDEKILDLKAIQSSLKRKNRFDRKFIVSVKSRVKLVSIEFKVTLWVDAKNTKVLLGKTVGEIVELYSSNFKIAAIY